MIAICNLPELISYVQLISAQHEGFRKGPQDHRLCARYFLNLFVNACLGELANWRIRKEPLDTVEMFDTWHGRWAECQDPSCATDPELKRPSFPLAVGQI